MTNAERPGFTSGNGCVVPGSNGWCLSTISCEGACQMPAQIRERAELSTSARLREVQGALAASQADLTRVERERDEALAKLGFALADARQTGVERDLAQAELASARQELELLRATHVPHTPEQEPQ